MQTKWGAVYSFDTNATLLASSVRTNRNRAGIPYSQTRSVRVHGYLSGAGQNALILAENALKTALARPYNDLLFYADDGTTLAGVSLRNVGSITGVVVVEGPSFTTTRGPEYATLRTFDFTAEAEYPLPNTNGRYLLEWREQITFAGGGPHRVVRPALRGAPQLQLVYEQTAFRATQSGSAVGYLFLPAVPPPKWPQFLEDGEPDSTETSPERKGLTGQQGYGITWSYRFISPVKLRGTQHPGTWNF